MATTNIDAFDWLRKQMDAAPNDAVKELLSQMVIRLMDAEVESVCGAEYGERTADRLNTRNGYRPRPWDTRVGTVELAS